MDAAIELRDLEIRFGDHVALTGVDLAVPSGASLAVVGVNGSGKSTLLGALANLYKPANGSVSVVGGAPSLVLQSTEVADGLPLTVRDSMKMARYPSLGLFRRFGSADNQAITHALERMDAAHLADMALRELSGGQRQRVLVAQGLAQDSSVLLLDEPMNALDAASRQLVLNAISDETRAGRTVVMTTHSLEDASHCDLVLVLDTFVVSFGTPADVLTEPNPQWSRFECKPASDHVVAN